MSESEWQAYMRRERRRARIDRIAGCAIMLGSAIIVAVLMWLALVGFLLVFGGQ